MPHIQQVEWPTIRTAVGQLVASWEPPDVIVGVSRGGVPIAIAISCSASSIPIGFIYRVAARGNSEAFYVFNEDRLAREKRHEAELRLTVLPGEPRSILVVDDVATYGGTLEVTRRLIARAHPDAIVRYFCFATDRDRLSSTRPWISESTSCHIEIDNSQVWLQFPWQQP